VMMDICP